MVIMASKYIEWWDDQCGTVVSQNGRDAFRLDVRNTEKIWMILSPRKKNKHTCFLPINNR